MKMKKLLVILPFTFTTTLAEAEVNRAVKSPTAGSVFEFSTEVSREVDRDLINAVIYSHKSGKSLKELKNAVSANLNNVLEEVKKYPNIKVQSNGMSQYPNYNNQNKVDGWTAEGSLNLESKDFEAVAKVLENLGNNVAIRSLNFTVSAEKLAAVEDEITLEIIKKFQRKANMIQQGINAKGYVITDVQLNTLDARRAIYNYNLPMAAMEKSASVKDEAIPLEAGKQIISATASGKVIFR